MTLVLGCSIVTVSTFSIPEFSGFLVFSIIFGTNGVIASGRWFVGGVIAIFSGAA